MVESKTFKHFVLGRPLNRANQSERGIISVKVNITVELLEISHHDHNKC